MRQIGNLKLNGYLVSDPPRIVRLSEMRMRLMGGVSDDVVEYEDVKMHWTVQCVDCSASERGAVYCAFRETEESTTWTARCDPGPSTSFCLLVPAEGGGGLSPQRRA